MSKKEKRKDGKDYSQESSILSTFNTILDYKVKLNFQCLNGLYRIQFPY
jgi:hypothetical protein